VGHEGLFRDGENLGGKGGLIFFPKVPRGKKVSLFGKPRANWRRFWHDYYAFGWGPFLGPGGPINDWGYPGTRDKKV